MQPTQVTETDPSARVVPDPRPSAPWRVVAVEPLGDMRLRVRFVDGTSGEVHLESFLNAPEVTGTVFAALRDPSLFQQVRVELGAVGWPNGAELAPDAMYDAIRESGSWVAKE